MEDHNGATISYTKEGDLNCIIGAKRTHRLDNEGIFGDALAFSSRNALARDILSVFFGRALGSTQLMQGLSVAGFVEAKEPGKTLPGKTRAILRMSWYLRILYGIMNSLLEPAFKNTYNVHPASLPAGGAK